tara:strand:+ start:51 stop:3155 length:3105 start_codon:yes stop_codon:yes gene_type:complete
MSSSGYNISITGDSNDSDLVLGSGSGSITENLSVDLTPLETKTATLETKTATLETKTATLETSMNSVEMNDVKAALQSLPGLYTKVGPAPPANPFFVYRFDEVTNDPLKIKFRWWVTKSTASSSSNLVVGSSEWDSWVGNSSNTVLNFDTQFSFAGYSHNPPGIILDHDWIPALDPSSAISSIKREKAFIYNNSNKRWYHLDDRVYVKISQANWVAEKARYVSGKANKYKVSDIHNIVGQSFYYPNVDVSYLTWAEQSVTLNGVSGPRYEVQGIVTRFVFGLKESGRSYYSGSFYYENDVNVQEQIKSLETLNTNLVLENKLLQQEVLLNRGPMAIHLPIVATNNTGVFSKGGNAYKLGFNSYGEFKNYNGDAVQKIRFLDHGYNQTKFTEKIIKNLKYTSTLIDVNQTASLGILSKDPSINGVLFAPGHSDQVFFNDPSYNSKIIPIFNYRNEFDSMLKQETIDNSNNMIFIFNLPNAYGHDLDAHYPTKCSTYNLYDLSGTTVLDTSLNLSGDVSNGPIVHSFYDFPAASSTVKSICTKIKLIKAANLAKNSTIYVRGFDFYSTTVLTVLLTEFSKDEIVLGYYSIQPPDTLLDLNGVRVISPFYLDTNTEFYDFTQFYDTGYTKCNDDYNFINGAITNMLIDKIYQSAGSGNDASFAAVTAAANNLNVTNADLTAAGFGNALYNDISGSELGDNLWVLRYNSSNHLQKKQIVTSQELTNPVGQALITLLSDISNIDGFKPHQYEIVPYSSFSYDSASYFNDINDNKLLAIEMPVVYGDFATSSNPVYARFAPIGSLPFSVNRTQYKNWNDSCGNVIIRNALNDLSFNNVNCYDLVTLGPAYAGWFKEPWSVIDNSYIDFSVNQPIRGFGNWKKTLAELGATTASSTAANMLTGLSNELFNSFEYNTPTIDLGYHFNTQTTATHVYDVSYIEPISVFNLFLNENMLQSLSEVDRTQILTCISNNYPLANANSDALDVSARAIMEADASFTIYETFDTSGEIQGMIQTAWNEVLTTKSADFSMVYQSMMNFAV